MPTKPSVFISYRRSDSSAISGRIYDRLSRALGKANVFKDSYNIPHGADFRGVIKSNVARCNVVLVIIGQTWLTVTEKNDPSSRRLDNPNDWVRFEVETGLQTPGTTVIPVLVQNATMPSVDELPPTLRELAYKNAIQLRDDPDFDTDVARLIQGLGKQTLPTGFITIGVIILLMAIVGVFLLSSRPDENTDGTLTTAQSAPLASPTTITPAPTDTAIPPTNSPVPTSTPIPTVVIQPSTTATAVIDLGATATEAMLQRTAVAQEATNVALIAENTRMAETATPEPTITFTPLELATTPVSQNSDWHPITQDFDGISMVFVPVGCFVLGSEEGQILEKPAVRKCFDKPFWIGETEVTNRQYGSEGYWGYPGDNRPRDNVTWIEAQRFCSNRGGRLPTEIEWEYAARGPDNRKYAWGNRFSATQVVYEDNSDQSAVVGSKLDARSWVGALDMNGNLWEWTASTYKPYSDEITDTVDNLNDTTSTRVLRGGAWTSLGSSLLLWTRYSKSALYENWDVGFRCMVPQE